MAQSLSQLAAADLLSEEEGASRRQILSRAATIAGAAVGLKLIETIATPAPAAAQSFQDGQDSD